MAEAPGSRGEKGHGAPRPRVEAPPSTGASSQPRRACGRHCHHPPCPQWGLTVRGGLVVPVPGLHDEGEGALRAQEGQSETRAPRPAPCARPLARAPTPPSGPVRASHPPRTHAQHPLLDHPPPTSQQTPGHRWQEGDPRLPLLAGRLRGPRVPAPSANGPDLEPEWPAEQQGAVAGAGAAETVPPPWPGMGGGKSELLPTRGGSQVSPGQARAPPPRGCPSQDMAGTQRAAARARPRDPGCGSAPVTAPPTPRTIWSSRPRRCDGVTSLRHPWTRPSAGVTRALSLTGTSLHGGRDLASDVPYPHHLAPSDPGATQGDPAAQRPDSSPSPPTPSSSPYSPAVLGNPPPRAQAHPGCSHRPAACHSQPHPLPLDARGWPLGTLFSPNKTLALLGLPHSHSCSCPEPVTTSAVLRAPGPHTHRLPPGACTHPGSRGRNWGALVCPQGHFLRGSPSRDQDRSGPHPPPGPEAEPSLPPSSKGRLSTGPYTPTPRAQRPGSVHTSPTRGASRGSRSSCPPHSQPSTPPSQDATLGRLPLPPLLVAAGAQLLPSFTCFIHSFVHSPVHLLTRPFLYSLAHPVVPPLSLPLPSLTHGACRRLGSAWDHGLCLVDRGARGAPGEVSGHWGCREGGSLSSRDTGPGPTLAPTRSKVSGRGGPATTRVGTAGSREPGQVGL